MFIDETYRLWQEAENFRVETEEDKTVLGGKMKRIRLIMLTVTLSCTFSYVYCYRVTNIRNLYEKHQEPEWVKKITIGMKADEVIEIIKEYDEPYKVLALNIEGSRRLAQQNNIRSICIGLFPGAKSRFTSGYEFVIEVQADDAENVTSEFVVTKPEMIPTLKIPPELQLRFTCGADLPGTLVLNYDDDETSVFLNTGLTLGLELIYHTRTSFQFGVGTKFQIPENKYSNPTYFLMPIYAIIRTNHPDLSDEVIYPYLIGQFGINAVTRYGRRDYERQNIYVSFGSGIQVGSYSLEILYSLNGNIFDIHVESRLSRISILCGFSL